MPPAQPPLYPRVAPVPWASALALPAGEAPLAHAVPPGAALMLYARHGALRVECEGALWAVPPQHAFWLPPAASPPSLSSAGSLVEAYRVLIHACPASAGPAGPTRLLVSGLLHELVVALLDHPATTSGTAHVSSAAIRLSAVLLDQLAQAPLQGTRLDALPLPSDPRLRRLIELVRTAPPGKLTLEAWGRRLGMSERTLRRAFQRETGLSIGQWHRRALLDVALQRLAAGDLVSCVAYDVGYESVSAFISMFKRILGTTPAQYAADRARYRPDADR